MASGKKKDKNDLDFAPESLIGNKKPVTDNDWWELFNKLATAINGVQRELGNCKGLSGIVELYSEQWKNEVDTKLSATENEENETEFRLKLMANIMIKQDEKIKELESKINQIHRRELRPNLIIQGIIEDRNESYSQLKAKIADFFKTQMLIEEEIEILDAYRKGASVNYRPVCVKLQHANDKSIIYLHASNLKDKANVRKKLFQVQDELDEEQTEKRRYYRDLLKESREVEEDPEKKYMVKMKKGDILINGHNKVKPKIQDASIADILRMDQKELEEVKATKLISGDSHMEKSSEFFSYAQSVKTEKDVMKGLSKMKIKFADATHISCGYRLQNPNGPFQQGYLDGDEAGQGRTILKALQEKSSTETYIFIVRYYGGTHLGPRRFQIGKDLSHSAIRNLKIAITARKKRRTQRVSQSSQMTDISYITEEEDSQDERVELKENGLETQDETK